MRPIKIVKQIIMKKDSSSSKIPGEAHPEEVQLIVEHEGG
jgi:hypothetical protein